MFKTNYFQMYSVSSKKKVFTKIFPFSHRFSVISKKVLIFRFTRQSHSFMFLFQICAVEKGLVDEMVVLEKGA